MNKSRSPHVYRYTAPCYPRLERLPLGSETNLMRRFIHPSEDLWRNEEDTTLGQSSWGLCIQVSFVKRSRDLQATFPSVDQSL